MTVRHGNFWERPLVSSGHLIADNEVVVTNRRARNEKLFSWQTLTKLVVISSGLTSVTSNLNVTVLHFDSSWHSTTVDSSLTPNTDSLGSLSFSRERFLEPRDFFSLAIGEGIAVPTKMHNDNYKENYYIFSLSVFELIWSVCCLSELYVLWIGRFLVRNNQFLLSWNAPKRTYKMSFKN